MSKAAELAALIGSQTAQSNRNLIINGAMNVAQRGTSSTSRDDYFTVDRIRSNANNTDNLVITSSQSTTSPDGFSSSYKVNVDTAESALASDENLKIMYIVEAQDLQLLDYGASGAKTTTLSFYVRSSTTGTYAVSVYANDSNTHIGGTYTINSANTWERKSLTFVGNTGSAITDDNGQGLQIEWFLAAGTDYTGTANTSWATFATGRYANGHAVNLMSATNNNWHITGIQFEVGEVATPFEHRTFADDLAACQRYFCKTFPPATAPVQNGGNNGSLIAVASGTATAPNRAFSVAFNYPVEMRASPTVTTFNPAGSDALWYKHTDGSTLAVTASFPSERSISLTNGASATDQQAYRIHATADAEL